MLTILLRFVGELISGIGIIVAGLILSSLVTIDTFIAFGFSEDWFGTDYSDPRGSALYAFVQLSCIVLFCIFLGIMLRGKRLDMSWGKIIRVINPISWFIAFFSLRLIIPFEPVAETTGLWPSILIFVGWLAVLPILLIARSFIEYRKSKL